MTSWLNELGLSTAASFARMSFSRMACGASAHPTRKPGARVLENVPRYTTPSCSTDRIAAGRLVVEVEQAVRVVLEHQDVVLPRDLEDLEAALPGEGHPGRVVEGRDRVEELHSCGPPP